MNHYVVKTSLWLHNFGRRFYGCREWTPDDDRNCKFFRWLNSNTCKCGAETAPIVIATFRRLENKAMLATESEKEARALLEEAHASLEEARDRKRVAKQKTEKSKVAQRIAEEKINTYKQVLVLS